MSLATMATSLTLLVRTYSPNPLLSKQESRLDKLTREGMSCLPSTDSERLIRMSIRRRTSEDLVSSFIKGLTLILITVENPDIQTRKDYEDYSKAVNAELPAVK